MTTTTTEARRRRRRLNDVAVPAISLAIALALAGCGGSAGGGDPATGGEPAGAAEDTGGGTATSDAAGATEATADTLEAPSTAPISIDLESSAFTDGGTIPKKHAFDGFGCTGQNVSPPLAWTGAPEGTKSYALVVHDPDAPTGVGFFHWVAFDIPADTAALAGGASAAEFPGVQGHTDYGANAWGGPCPPPGDDPHRYLFTLYAVDTETLGLGPETTGALLRFVLGQHALARGRLVGTYGRPAE